MTIQANPIQSAAAFAAARAMIDNAGIGWEVSDEHCRQLSDAVCSAVINAPAHQASSHKTEGKT